MIDSGSNLSMCKSNVERSFDYTEVLFVVQTGIISTLFSLCFIAWFLCFIIPLNGEINSAQLFFFTSIKVEPSKRGIVFLILLISCIVVVMLPSIQYVLADRNPVLWISGFLLHDSYKRLYLCIYWICLIITSVFAAQILAIKCRWPKFCTRKIFHFLMVLIIAPGIFMDELMSFTILALGVALCAFFVLETYRVTVLVPLLDDCITSYYRLFLDEKDLTGYWVSSNISLLIGCAFPVVLWAYWNERRSCVNVETGLACSFPSKMQYGVCRSENARVVSNVEMLEAVRPLLPHLGWITVGVGDSFAAILGYRYGIHKWRGTSRTVEGSVAMFMSMAFVSFCTLLVGLNNPHISLYDNVKVLADSKNILPSVIALSLTTLMEAFTSKNDNWVLPLFAVVVFVVVTWIHLCYNR